MADEQKPPPQDRQPAETPMTADQWAKERLIGLYKLHRRGWLRAVRDRGMLRTYQSGSAWQADFEKWGAQPVTK
jgi:hypothetical protein